jgi:hypothetical protein
MVILTIFAPIVVTNVCVIRRTNIMDQKNTIVKCFVNPNCLFNHNGICDNYVINIGADGSCQEYIETASEEEAIYENTKKMLEKAGVTLIEAKGEVKRGQRAKCNFFVEDMMDINDKHLGEAVTVVAMMEEKNEV